MWHANSFVERKAELHPKSICRATECQSRPKVPNPPQGVEDKWGRETKIRFQFAGPKIPSRQSDDSTGYSAFIFYQRVPQIHTGDAQSNDCETFVNRTERENFERQRNYSGQDDPQHNVDQTDHRLKI